jgi:hypothetical protein
LNSRNLIRAQGSVASLMELNRRKPRPQSRQPRKLSAKHLVQGSHRWLKSQRRNFSWFSQWIFRQPKKKWIDIDIYTYLYWIILQSQTFWWIQSLMSPHVIVKYQHFNELQKLTNYTTKKMVIILYHSSSWIFTGHLFNFCPRNFHGFRALAFESPANAWLTFSSARRVQRSQALNGARHVSMPISALFKGPGPEILSCFSCRKTYLLCTILYIYIIYILYIYIIYIYMYIIYLYIYVYIYV